MASFKISADTSQLDVLAKALSPATMQDAINQAGKRTANKGKVQFKNRIAEEMNITKSAIPVYTRSADAATISIVISGRPTKLIDFKPKSTAAGVTVQIKKSDAPTLLRHAFTATVGKGEHRGVFARLDRLHVRGAQANKGKLTPKGYSRRLPIGEMHGPSVASVIGGARLTVIGTDEMSKLGKVYAFELASQLSRNMGISATAARGMLGVPEPAGE